MLSFLYELFDSYELMKAIVIACIIVGLIRAWAYSVKDRTEKEEQALELEEGAERQKALDQIIPVSKSIHEENDCVICKKPIWTREGIEIEKGCTVELKCTHFFHWHCLNKDAATSSTNSLTDGDSSSYVMVEKVPCCPVCLFQPAVIEAKPLHKWQTVRFWVLIIDEALDQLATMSGKRGIAWASVRARARKMSGISVEQLAKGEAQTHGTEDMLPEEDLDGPGQFPYFAALKDGNALRFQDSIENVYHTSAGKWMTYQSTRGGERMVFKYSWGIPPDTKCHNCSKYLGPCAEEGSASHSDARDCQVCGHVGCKKLHWCSDACYETHGEECKHLMNKMERFRITQNLSKK